MQERKSDAVIDIHASQKNYDSMQHHVVIHNALTKTVYGEDNLNKGNRVGSLL